MAEKILIHIMNLATDHPATKINNTEINGTNEVPFIFTVASTLTLYAGDLRIEQGTIGTGGVTAKAAKTCTAFNVTLDFGVGAKVLVSGAGDDT